MITGKQIRAARSLLNIKQTMLAELSGLSAASLTAIEQEHVAPRSSNLLKIEAVLRGHGIKFSEGHGVSLSDDIFHVEVFEGKSAFQSYMQSVTDTLKEQGGIAVHSHIDEGSHIRKNRDVFFQYYQEMEKHNLKEKLLICEGVRTVYGAAPMAEYRWIKQEYFHDTGYSVYGDKYAIIFPDLDNRTVVIENKGLAETFRRQFQHNWDSALRPTLNKSLYLEDK